MMLPVRAIGSKGIAPDVPSWDLPLTHATVAHNCRVVAGHLVSTNGHQLVEARSIDDSLRIIGPGSNITPHVVGGWATEGVSVWAICGILDGQSDYRIWLYDGNDLREAGSGYITPDFTFNPLNTWLLAHNPDHPTQIIDGISGTFIDLPGWDTYIDGPSWRAGNVVPFGPFLVAGPIIGPVAKDFTIAWSDEIPPDIVSTVPISWAALPTTLAGENVLDPRAGAIITMLPLGQQLIIYCRDAVWSMTYIGGPLVFNFRQLFTDDGILNKHCVAQLDDNTHMVIGKHNIYTHNGSTKTFPGESRTKNFFYGELKNVDNVRVHAQRWRNEAVLAYDVNEDDSTLSRCLIYNYTYDAWTTAQLPFISGMSEAPLPVDFESWAEKTDTWDDTFDPWREYYAKGLDISVMVSPSNRAIYRDGIGTKYDQTQIIAIMRLERMDFDHLIEGKATDRFMLIRRLYPQIRGNGYVRFSMVGYQRPEPVNVYNVSAEEEDGIVFNINTGYKVDKIVTGRYINLELRSTQFLVVPEEELPLPDDIAEPEGFFMLSGIDFDMIPQGYRE